MTRSCTNVTHCAPTPALSRPKQTHVEQYHYNAPSFDTKGQSRVSAQMHLQASHRCNRAPAAQPFRQHSHNLHKGITNSTCLHANSLPVRDFVKAELSWCAFLTLQGSSWGHSYTASSGACNAAGLSEVPRYVPYSPRAHTTETPQTLTVKQH